MFSNPLNRRGSVGVELTSLQQAPQAETSSTVNQVLGNTSSSLQHLSHTTGYTGTREAEKSSAKKEMSVGATVLRGIAKASSPILAIIYVATRPIYKCLSYCVKTTFNSSDPYSGHNRLAECGQGAGLVVFLGFAGAVPGIISSGIEKLYVKVEYPEYNPSKKANENEPKVVGDKGFSKFMQHENVHNEFPKHVKTLNQIDKIHPHKLSPDNLKHFEVAQNHVGKAAELYKERYLLRQNLKAISENRYEEKNKPMKPDEITKRIGEIQAELEKHLADAKRALEQIPEKDRTEAEKFW